LLASKPTVVSRQAARPELLNSREEISMLNSFEAWFVYFSSNAQDNGKICFDQPDFLTSEEILLIGDSIATFQLGEQSEGRGLLKAAKAFADQNDLELVVPITRMFVREEQNHSLLLGKFMGLHGISLKTRNWSDWVFRRLRKGAPYQWSIMVLITAEIVAITYYRALKNATDSALLESICEKILKDEAFHLRYEAEVISAIRSGSPRLVAAAMEFCHRFLFFGTVVVVYLSHRRVLKVGGYRFRRFWSGCWREFSTCFDQPQVSLQMKSSTNSGVRL